MTEEFREMTPEESKSLDNERKIVKNIVSSFFDQLLKEIHKASGVDAAQKLLLLQVCKAAKINFSRMSLGELQELVPSVNRMIAQFQKGIIPPEFGEIRNHIQESMLQIVCNMLVIILTQFEKCIHEVEKEIEKEKSLV